MYNYMNEKKKIYEDRTNKNVVGELTFNRKKIVGPINMLQDQLSSWFVYLYNMRFYLF